MLISIWNAQLFFVPRKAMKFNFGVIIWNNASIQMPNLYHYVHNLMHILLLLHILQAFWPTGAFFQLQCSSTLDWLWNSASIHVHNLMHMLLLLLLLLFCNFGWNEHFSPSSAGIKIVSWINSSGHEKFCIWTGPKINNLNMKFAKSKVKIYVSEYPTPRAPRYM